MPLFERIKKQCIKKEKHKFRESSKKGNEPQIQSYEKTITKKEDQNLEKDVKKVCKAEFTIKVAKPKSTINDNKNAT